MECPHPHLTRILNMPDGTYRCDRCNDLVNVTIGPVKMPEPVFGTPKQEDKKE